VPTSNPQTPPCVAEPRDLTPLLERALARDPAGVRALVDALLPVIQARVARALRRSARRPGDVRRELDDLMQEVLTTLFADDARTLRAWVPARGLSLPNFVGMVADHVTANHLESGRRNPWRESPSIDVELEARAGSEDSLEGVILSRDLLRALVDALRAQLSPLGLQLFYALMIEDRPVEELAPVFEMTPAALYAWRSRLAKLARSTAAELVPASERVRARTEARYSPGAAG
jgi:RNA polymerase sigma-70 factor (ECF subfamily)